MLRFEQAELFTWREECNSFRDSIKYRGGSVDKTGKPVSTEKPKAILEMPHPVDVGQSRSFLGMMNHYGKFAQPFERLLVDF